MKIVLLVFQVIVGLQPVTGATCSNLTSRTCEDTDFTSSTCNSTNTCSCKIGRPIPSGCAGNLDKPRVDLSSGIQVVLSGRKVTLICSTTNSRDGLVYEWTRNGTVVKSETNYAYVIESTNQDNVGQFRCKTKYETYLESAESDTLTISLLSNDSVVNPRVGGVPELAANGSQFSAYCVGIPEGVNYTLKDQLNRTLNSRITATADMQNDTITCVLNATGFNFRNMTSSPASMPTIVNEITNVTITVDNQRSTELIFKTGTYINVTCSTFPLAMYMNAGDVSVVFTITDSFSNVTVSDVVYNVQNSTGTHVVACTASYNGNSRKTNVTITFSDNYVPTPVLKANNLTGVDTVQLLEGSRLVLACGDPQPGVIFSWNKNDADIYYQYDRVIQYDNITAAAEGNYTCTLRKKDYIVISNTVTVVITEDISKPQIHRRIDGEYFGENGDYDLLCITTSATVGMTYAWEKANASLSMPTASNSYTLHTVTASKDNGTYTCVAGFVGQTSESAAFSVSVQAAGKACTKETDKNDCSGTGYTGVCSSTPPYRCECSSKYIRKGESCQSLGTAAVSSCILLVISTAIVQLMT